MTYRVAVVGATGAVGRNLLALLAERDFPASEIVAFASERSAGTDARGPRRRARRAGAERGGDRRLRRRPVLGRLGDVEGVGAALRGRRRRGHRQLLAVADGSAGPARRRRGQPRRDRAASGDRRQPQLHDHADGGRAEAAARRRGHRASRRLHLPVDLRDRHEGGQRAEGPGPRDPARLRTAAADRLPAPDRLQRPAPGGDVQGRRRLHDRRTQGDGRDAQDPRRARAAHQRHLRARAGADRPLRVGQPADPRRALARARPRAARRRARRAGARRPGGRPLSPSRSMSPARTTCSSGGSAATRRPSAR